MEKRNPLIISDEQMLHPDDTWGKGKQYRYFEINKVNDAKEDKITRLSDVLTELPYGIVFKDETGMGATTLELISKRNSIIVEPVKITASSKAFKHKALYVGGPTKYQLHKTEDEEIFSYLNDPEGEFKKIIVVADSLGRVINAILMANPYKQAIEHIRLGTEKINALNSLSEEQKLNAVNKLNSLKDPNVLKHSYDKSALEGYFLLLDEIDSFQLDSSYRKSMEDCLDYYKMFPKEKRCMLSATDIRFNDPDLKDEAITFIKYSEKNKRQIEIIISKSKQLQGKAYDRIVETLNNYPDDKILIAFNSVKGCYNLAENLKLKKNIKEEEIAILCSVQSEARVTPYFKELDSDQLPKRLNFITSAYFTGFDLQESFHLISISGNRSNIQALSEKRLKQIAGRSRTGLKTETIIHDIVVEEIDKKGKKQGTTSKKEGTLKINKPDPTKDELIAAATEQVLSMNCMNNHYKKNKMLNDILKDVNIKFMKLLDEKQMRFIRTDINENNAISYLNIDAKLELIRVRNELYLSDDALTLKLQKEGHSVNIIERIEVTEISDSKLSYDDNNRKVREIIEKLKEVKNNEELNAYFKIKGLTTIQKTIVRDFKKFYSYYESGHILDKIEKSLIDKRDNREYNSLVLSAQMQTLPDGHIVIDRLKHYFETGKKYNALQILRRMNLYLLEIGNAKELKKIGQAVPMLKKFCFVYKKQKKQGMPVYHHIKNYNPKKLQCIKKRSGLEKIEISSNIWL